jgi:hypothetical protein
MATNPNSPNYPYSGGTDNPGDDTSKAGGGIFTSSGRPSLNPLALAAGVARHAGIIPTLAQSQEDTTLGALQAVPPTASGFESLVDRGADPEGGIDPVTGSPRQSGQDEVAGATETTSGVSPVAFPEPNP